MEKQWEDPKREMNPPPACSGEARTAKVALLTKDA